MISNSLLRIAYIIQDSLAWTKIQEFAKKYSPIFKIYSRKIDPMEQFIRNKFGFEYDTMLKEEGLEYLKNYYTTKIDYLNEQLPQYQKTPGQTYLNKYDEIKEEIKKLEHLVYNVTHNRHNKPLAKILNKNLTLIYHSFSAIKELFNIYFDLSKANNFQRIKKIIYQIKDKLNQIKDLENNYTTNIDEHFNIGHYVDIFDLIADHDYHKEDYQNTKNLYENIIEQINVFEKDLDTLLKDIEDLKLPFDDPEGIKNKIIMAFDNDINLKIKGGFIILKQFADDLKVPFSSVKKAAESYIKTHKHLELKEISNSLILRNPRF